jgi:hypothetical protein
VVICLDITAYQLNVGQQIMFQLNGTALPSLALENFQELESMKLRGSDRDEAEEMIAGALASIYAG